VNVQSAVFMRGDIRCVLKAVDGTSHDLAARMPVAEVGIYRAGFTAAIEAIATAFGIIDLDDSYRLLVEDVVGG